MCADANLRHAHGDHSRSEPGGSSAAAIAADRNSPQKHVWRVQIVLLTTEGCGTAEIMRRVDVSNTTVWRWQDRYHPFRKQTWIAGSIVVGRAMRARCVAR